MNTNERISEVEHSRIYRIIEGSVKEGTLNHDFLVDFIIKSIDSRFIFHKFINISFIKFLEDEDEEKESRTISGIHANQSFIYIKTF